MLAKTTFEQKQKLIDALDNAKAAELALRELLGFITRTSNIGPQDDQRFRVMMRINCKPSAET
jgi:hypothetical protein